MGRMFRIITEGNGDHPAVAVEEPFVLGSSAPFIEVGGPTGVVHSLPKPPSRLVVTEAPARPAVPTRQTIDDRYLSVALHQIAVPKPAEPTPSTISPDVVAYHHPTHAVSAEYRALRDEVKRQVGTDGPKAVVFTAAASDNGTTTVMLNLAVSLAAEAGTRVLVVDAELDRPAAAKKMGLSDVPGLSEVLAQSVPLAWVLQPTAVARLQVLGAGRPIEGTVAALATDLPRVVSQLRQWFDWILVDGGVWGARPHRDGASPAFDGVYLVTRQAELDRPVFHALRADVARHGGLLRGYITTRA